MANLRKRDTGEYPVSQTEADRRIRAIASCGPVINYDEFGYDVVFAAPPPAYDPMTQYAREIEPLLTPLGKYQQQYEILDLDAETIAANQARAQEQLIASITTATQARLDDFAKTRNYDGILSACTYASSTVPKFAAEGQYCVNARDETWATLYSIMGAIQAGTHPVPTGYADIEAELPVLEWPA